MGYQSILDGIDTEYLEVIKQGWIVLMNVVQLRSAYRRDWDVRLLEGRIRVSLKSYSKLLCSILITFIQTVFGMRRKHSRKAFPMLSVPGQMFLQQEMSKA